MVQPRLCVVTACKGRLPYLKRSLPTFVAQHDSEVVVVDYDCPEGTHRWVSENFPQVRLVVVAKAPCFNLSRARNLGAQEARADWIVFCDADQLLAPSFALELFDRVSSGTYLRTLRKTQWGPRRQGVPLACEAAIFRAIGGYDDAFQGWGVEDRDFIDRLDRSGIRQVVGPTTMVDTLPHGNAERSSFYEHRIEVSMAINHYYRKIKHRYFETTGSWLTDEQRHATYGKVEQAVLESLAHRESRTVFDVRIVGSDPPWMARVPAQSVRHFLDTKCQFLAQVAPT